MQNNLTEVTCQNLAVVAQMSSDRSILRKILILAFILSINVCM